MNTRKITQRELRNHCGEILRAVDRGETFIITRHGAEVGILTAARRPDYVRREAIQAAFAAAAPVDPDRFRADLDVDGDQEPTPRG
jgi:prevent-host-death family protein